METFKNWLYCELVSEGSIDEDTSLDELTEDFLITETDVDSYDIAAYKQQYADECERRNVTPVWDVMEMQFLYSSLQ